MGPHLRAVNQAMAPAMPARIDAADDRATRVFGVGVGLALSILVPMALVVVSLLLYLLATGLAGSPRHGLWAFWAFFGAGLFPFLALFFLDRRLGHRIPAQGAPGRLLRRVLGLYARFGIGRASNPLLALFQSSEGARRTGVLIAVVIAASTSLVMGRLLYLQGGGSWGAFAGLPEDDPTASDTVPADLYASTRSREPSPLRLPHIQDRVVKGPYLELFVPYAPRRHGPALADACPEAVAVAEAGGPARGALQCLARLIDLRLDGAPLPIQLDASTDQLTGQRGLLAMIPVEGLAAGRHELTLRSPPRRAPRPGDPPRLPYRIPFWR